MAGEERDESVEAKPRWTTVALRELFWPYGAYRRVRSPLQRTLRWSKRVLAVLFLAYAALCFHPQPLFAHTVRAGNLVVHAQEDGGPGVPVWLEDARARVGRSALFRANEDHHVFLCDGWLPYRVFRPIGGGGEFASANPLTRNVFVAHPDAKEGRAWRDAARRSESRSLAAVVAHEVTHDLIRSRLGYFGTRGLPPWKEEGYCEYVAGDGSFDFARGLALLEGGRSAEGLSFRYFHWRMCATYALDVARMDVLAFFDDRAGFDDWDRRMRAALKDGTFRPTGR